MGERKDVLKLRIARKTYLFDTRKKFAYTKRFGMRKEKVGLEKLADFSSVFAARKGAGKGAGGAAAGAKAAGRGGGFPLKTVGIVALVLFALFAALILSLPRAVAVGGEEEAALALPDVSFSLLDSGVVTVGDEKDATHAVYSVVSYKTANIRNATFTARVYDSKVPEQVFVLDYPRQEAVTYDKFRAALGDELAKRGIGVTDIPLELVDSLPEAAVVIVPTGYVPIAFLDDFNLTRLGERGVVIVYIGHEFERALRSDGTLQRGIEPERYKGLRVSFRRESPTSTEGFGLRDARYAVLSQGASSQMLYGSLSSVPLGRGSLIFVPQTIDGGWRSNGEAAGRDIARLVREYAWKRPVGEGEADFETEGEKANGTFTVFSSPYKGVDSYTVFYFEGRGEDGGIRGVAREVFTRRAALGELYSRAGSKVLSTGITGDRVRLSAELNEKKPGRISAQLQTLRDNEVVRSEIIPGDIDIQGTHSIDYDANVPPGTYLLRLADDEGNAYAQGGITIGDVEVVNRLARWGEGAFKFDIMYEDRPYLVSKVRVSVDGKGAQEFFSASTIDYTVEGVSLQPNNEYEFKFELGGGEGGGVTKIVRMKWAVTPQFYENPLFVTLAVLSVVIFCVGFYLKRPDVEMLGLDIPDFPPTSTIKVPVKKESVLGVFEQVNKDYAWERMPLKLEEIKNGFRKLNYRGRQLMIGDYNLERILETLESKGLVRQDGGYYGLAKWEQESGKGIGNLAVLRRMRDVFVANVVRFSKFGERSDCDTLINLGYEAYVHVYDGERTVGRAAGTCGSGITLVVFRSEEERGEFERMLSSPSRAGVGLKLEVQVGRAKLVSVGSLDAMIKQMKG